MLGWKFEFIIGMWIVFYTTFMITWIFIQNLWKRCFNEFLCWVVTCNFSSESKSAALDYEFSVSSSVFLKMLVCSSHVLTIFFSLFRFYVGCDVCSNWFHGSCVGINETMAKNMTEYICDECRNARENREIYCICQQPYDETQ